MSEITLNQLPTEDFSNLPVEFAEMAYDDHLQNDAVRIVQLQRQLEELDFQKPAITAYYEERRDVLEQLAKLSGTDSYFQSADGDVYKIVEAKGKFVSFDKYDYVRTKREGERAGTLSVKEAEAAGFTLPAKAKNLGGLIAARSLKTRLTLQALLGHWRFIRKGNGAGFLEIKFSNSFSKLTRA